MAKLPGSFGTYTTCSTRDPESPDSSRGPIPDLIRGGTGFPPARSLGM